eukprot:4242949-Lingulodinium_polyedra.AAC.1
MADPRVPMQVEKLSGIITEDLDWLVALSSGVWNEIALHVCKQSVTGSELRSHTLQAALAAAGFFNMRSLKPATELPWSLATGDVDRNL